MHNQSSKIQTPLSYFSKLEWGIYNLFSPRRMSNSYSRVVRPRYYCRGNWTEMEEVRDERAHSPTECSDEDDPPMLSAQALEALREFFGEQNRALVDDDSAGGSRGSSEQEGVALVAEDWRLSQFWYDRNTSETVAKEVLSLCGSLESPSIACIACPTLYAYLKKSDPSVPAQLLEYDNRFEQYGSEFTFYDYNQPEELPSSLKNAYQIVVADPPYLSKECLEKVTQTISFLVRPGKSYLLLLAGEVQKDRAAELLGLYPCGFRPQHSSKLGNEFRLFTNYDPGMRLGGWERNH